jgi:hypothetical protein
MGLFAPGTLVKFHLKPEFDSAPLKAALHVTADGFYHGIYFPAHVSRAPEVKRGGQLVSRATAETTPEHVCPMKPSGENLMLPDMVAETFKRVTFTMDQLDLASLHECDHLDHLPPGRKVNPNWKPKAQQDAEDAAKTPPAAPAAPVKPSPITTSVAG